MVNISANICFTNKFLGNSFLTYGIKVLNYYNNYDGQLNPMEVIFPRIANCNFFKFGPSGTVQNIDVLCILVQNMLNEKIYLFLWFWFFILTILSVLTLIYKLVFITQITTKRIILLNMFKYTSDKHVASAIVSKFQVRDLETYFYFQLNSYNLYNVASCCRYCFVLSFNT